MELRLLSLNIGRARVIGTVHGEKIVSAIGKLPVTGDVQVFTTGLQRDEQADLSVHGGFDKAVYAYPSDHWAWWETERNLVCRPATFGENLTVAGADEHEIAIGDRFQWGDAVLEVSQPRAPCFKLGLHTQRPDIPGLLTRSARSGWYMRVVQEGRSGAAKPLTRIHRSNAPSVRDAFLALFDARTDRELARRVFEVPELARDWRAAVGKKIR